MTDFWVESRIDLDHLAAQMADELGKDALLEFVKTLDLRVSEWDFTVKLRDFFNAIDYSEVES
ncbi:hypothetical protein [Streptomyces sp. NPDC006355]|uniref:hypothetical protein n=1 Tax=Streptomyces sp. NPDC006355 TaxID=3156758 RepID=UPI0033BBF899